MERLFSGRTPSERRALRSLAVSGSVHGREAELLDLEGAATNSLNALRDAREVTTDDGRARIANPVLADWTRDRFPT